MSVPLYDSDDPDTIPDGVFAAGYVDGYAAPAWAARGWSRFPNARRIAVSAATNDGDVGDVENGDMLPWELPDWIVMRRNAGVADPWGYVNLSNWAPTRTEFQLRGIPEPNWWVADYDGVAEVPAGAVAKQYADPAIIPGNPHYDLSVVLEAFGPGGGTIGGNMAELVEGDNGDGKVYVTDWMTKRYITDPGALPGWYAIFGVTAPRKVPAGVLGEVPDQAIGGGATEPPEPAEPKTVTLHVPAIDIPGTLA